jgi:hypothetical protein
VSKAVVRLGMVAFVVLDVVLVIGVLRYVQDTPPSSADVPASTRATPSPESSESAQDPFEFAPASAVSISLANDGTLLYATRGQCDGDADPKLTVSTDGGASTSTPDTGLAEITAVSATSRTDLHVVGADGDCVPQRLASTDGGETWVPESENDVWTVDIDKVSDVVSPDDTTDAGCTVTSLSQVGENFGRVSCADGTIRGTGNGGAKWVDLGRLDNVRVTTFTTFNAGYALAVYQGCAAQAFATRDGGRTWAPKGCISGEPARAISANDTGLAAVVDDQLYVSDNGGTDWSQP